MGISLKVIGLTRLASKLKSMSGKAATLTGQLKIASIIAWRDVQDHFKNEEGPEGKWAPLRPSTLAFKKRHGYKGILKNEGNLRNSFMYSSTAVDAYVGSNLSYLKQHQFGEPKKNLPARPPLWLSEGAKKNIEGRFLSYVTN